MYTNQDLLKDIIKEAVNDVISERLIGTVWKPYDKRPTNAMSVERDKTPPAPVPEKKEIPAKNNTDNTKDSKIVLYKKLKRQAM
jgi:hypothetical protein